MSLKKRMGTAWKHYRISWKLHPILYLTDISFLVVSFLTFITLMVSATEKVKTMTEASLKEIQKMQLDIRPELATPDMFNQVMGNTPAISRMFTEVILLFFAIIFLLYLFWIFFQGINWVISNNIVKKMEKPWKYFLRFSVINIYWVSILLILGYFWFNITFYNMKSLIPLVNQTLLNVIWILLIGAVAYFSVISFVLARKHSAWKSFKRSFSHGIKYVVDFLTMFIVIIGMIAISFMLTWFIYPVSQIGAFIALLITFIPLLSFIRFYAVVTVEDVVKN